MAIPVESSEVQEFTPDSLKETMGDDAPVFRLKAASERCIRRFRQLVADDGLETFSAEEFNAEKLRAIDLYWSDDVAQSYKDKLKAIIEKQKQDIDLSDEEVAWADQLDEELYGNHRPLNVMRRKAGEFQQYSPRHTISTYVTGWKGLDTAFRLDAGVIHPEAVSALENELEKLGKKHTPGTPHLPFLELFAECGKRINMDEDEEKNSPAPSQNSSSPEASTANVKTDGESTAEKELDARSSSRSKPKKTPAKG